MGTTRGGVFDLMVIQIIVLGGAINWEGLKRRPWEKIILMEGPEGEDA